MTSEATKPDPYTIDELVDIITDAIQAKFYELGGQDKAKPFTAETLISALAISSATHLSAFTVVSGTGVHGLVIALELMAEKFSFYAKQAPGDEDLAKLFAKPK